MSYGTTDKGTLGLEPRTTSGYSEAANRGLQISRRLAIFVVPLCSLLVTVARPAGATTPGTWQSAGRMSVGRQGHVAVLLRNDKVLVVGGAKLFDEGLFLSSLELFDPLTRTWSTGASMSTGRSSAAGTLLADGRVLVAGGFRFAEAQVALASAEVYDPTTDSWSSSASMTAPRAGATATLLADGRVLLAGGMSESSVAIDTAELYDPHTNQWAAVPPMSEPRALHSATLLNDGRVLVAGGGFIPPADERAEIYDPAVNRWSPAGSMNVTRYAHGTALLHDGRVLVAGGHRAGAFPITKSADIYDPATNAWSQAADMSLSRGGLSAVTLASGEVLVAGGNTSNAGDAASAEAYDPQTNSWSSAGRMSEFRSSPSGTLLADGSVLIVGGCCEPEPPYSRPSAEIFTPSLACPPEVTDQLGVLRFRIHRIPFTPFRFQWVLLRNKTADPIPGPLAFVMDDLQHALFIGSRLRTTCFSETGDPIVVIHAGSDDVLSQGESALTLLWFFKTQPGRITYKARVLSGIPTQ